MFDLLLKYEKSKISATSFDELSLNTLNYFCLKFKIIPFMIVKNTLNKIFSKVSEKEEKVKSKPGVNCQGF